MTVIQWVADFSERIKQLQMISQGAASGGAKELKVLLCVLNDDPLGATCHTHAPTSLFLVSRTSTFVSAACLCQRLTLPPPASMWLRLTAGLWRSCVWRSTSPMHRVPHWTPAASASKVRRDLQIKKQMCTGSKTTRGSESLRSSNILLQPLLLALMTNITVHPGLKLQGATCTNNKLSLSTTISTELPLTQLHWIKQSSTEKRHTVKDQHSRRKPTGRARLQKSSGR